MDWYSRYVLSWELSTTLEVDFCINALNKALTVGKLIIQTKEIQVRSLSKYLGKMILISMDSRGRVFDNIFTKRLWRSLKYEEVYIKDYSDVREVKEGIEYYGL